MRRFVLAFGLLVAACTGDDVAPAHAPGGDGGASSSSSSSGGGVDGSTSDDAGGASDAGVKPLGPARVYVGSGDGKIRLFSFDAAGAALAPVQTIDAGSNPSFLAIEPGHRFLYAVDEGQSQVRAFSVEGATGKLAAIGAPIGSGGDGPAHVSVDRAGKVVMVANYGGGTIAVFARQPDGTLATPPSATRAFGAGAETHQIVTDPTNAWVFVPNKGKDAVSVFGLDASGALTDVSLAGFAAGDGARHIAVDTTSTHAYVVDELGNTVTVMTLDTKTGTLASVQTVSTLEPTFSGSNTTAEIALTKDGKHVIASNRGDDSLAVFDVAADGKLTRTARVSTGGKAPRHFSIDETGELLFVGNQASGSIVVMKIDGPTGVPSPIGAPVLVPSPAYVGIVHL